MLFEGEARRVKSVGQHGGPMERGCITRYPYRVHSGLTEELTTRVGPGHFTPHLQREGSWGRDAGKEQGGQGLELGLWRGWMKLPPA